jgi:crotonobetaine/carnitine-CoA ligase
MYSGLNDPSRWVLPLVLAEQAEARPSAPWIVTVEGERWTFGEARADVMSVAGFFEELGVKPGDRVVLMLPNGIDYVRAWLGLLSIGAVAVLLNTELRGAFLAHQLQNAAAALAVVHESMLATLEAASTHAPELRTVLVVGAAGASAPVPPTTRLHRLPWEAWRVARPRDGTLPLERDIACIMYTSGTSGPAKGVLMPHAHCTLFGIGTLRAAELRADDRYYIVLPLFHSNGLLMQLGATLLAGIPAVLRPRFSASAWLADIREHGATVTNLLGVLAAFIVGQPRSEHDRDHRLRAVLNGPNPPELERVLRERFGVADVISGFGMTEINMPVLGRVGRSTPGASGWVQADHFELIVADPQTDRAVPTGEVGEILVRPKVPWGFMAGYQGMPEKTVEAWRNLWFHTGDAGRLDAEGVLAFVDRIKDCIRRRGENIAATEVENIVATLQGVAEVAAYAVPADIPGGEDELMLSIVPAAGVKVSVTALASIGDAAEALLPRFARPRYLRWLNELPKTATGKVQRAVLRQAGSAAALDRGNGAQTKGPAA